MRRAGEPLTHSRSPLTRVLIWWESERMESQVETSQDTSPVRGLYFWRRSPWELSLSRSASSNADRSTQAVMKSISTDSLGRRPIRTRLPRGRRLTAGESCQQSFILRAVDRHQLPPIQERLKLPGGEAALGETWREEQPPVDLPARPTGLRNVARQDSQKPQHRGWGIPLEVPTSIRSRGNPAEHSRF